MMRVWVSMMVFDTCSHHQGVMLCHVWCRGLGDSDYRSFNCIWFRVNWIDNMDWSARAYFALNILVDHNCAWNVDALRCCLCDQSGDHHDSLLLLHNGALHLIFLLFGFHYLARHLNNLSNIFSHLFGHFNNSCFRVIHSAFDLIRLLLLFEKFPLTTDYSIEEAVLMKLSVLIM